MTEPNFSAIRARLRYDSVDEFIDGYSRYVTSGGMFIPMAPAKLKPVGTTVRFQFVLGDGATALLGEGVVRQIRGLESEETDSPIGMLVKFTKLSQDSKVLIDRIVALKEIEKLGVDMFSDNTDAGAYSEVAGSESADHESTTGNYSLAALTSAGGSEYTASEDIYDDEELFSERTGRLEASELAGLGASTFGDPFDESQDDAEQDYFDGMQDAVAEEEPVKASSSFQEWGPEPEESEGAPIEAAGSGELSLDIFSFNTDDFGAAGSSDLFANEESSNELSFDFDFEVAEASKSVEAAIDFPEISMDESSKSPEISTESPVFADGDVVSDDLGTVDGDSADGKSDLVESDIASHVVRETRGGIQIMSFDGSADESVDRDFEQFALGSDDDVDSMFDDVFGDAFDGAFSGMDAAADEEEVGDPAPEIEAFAETSAPELEEANEVSEGFDAIEQVSVESESSLFTATGPPPSPVPSVASPVPQAGSQGDVEDSAVEHTEEHVAAILFGEESEAFSDENVAAEEPIEAATFELGSDAFDLSTEFGAPAIESGQEAVSAGEDDVFGLDMPGFELNEDVDKGDEVSIEEMVAEMPKSSVEKPVPPRAPAPMPPPVSVAKADVGPIREDKQERQSENSSDLLSLLGALEESGVEEDDALTLGASLSLSHGLGDKSSPVLDDEPDSLSALLASAQKELEARSAVSEEERQRDAIDDLLGDDSDLPLPPIPVASPFAVPEVPEKRRKGFMSKLFGKD